jgi:hypothetical protein
MQRRLQLAADLFALTALEGPADASMFRPNPWRSLGDSSRDHPGGLFEPLSLACIEPVDVLLDSLPVRGVEEGD